MKYTNHFTILLSAVILLLIVCVRQPLAASKSAGTYGVYKTNFSRTENPIREGGKWLNGQTDGLDWTNVRTTRGFAFGTEIGGNRPAPQKYDDSTALLKGNWGPDQTVQATVHLVDSNRSGEGLREVELRLRSSIAPHVCTGYEVMFFCAKTPHAYCNIARWEGPFGQFTMIKETRGSQYGVKDGDVVKATMIGKILTVYINGVQLVQLSDDKFPAGNPGIGYYLEGATGVMGEFGFSNFMATDR